MPRHSSSDSRSRSRHRNKRAYRDDSSDYEDHRRSSRNDKHHKQREDSPPPKVVYDIKKKSDIKHHFRYDNIRIHNPKEAEDTIRQVRQVLSDEFGPVAEATKLSKDENILSFGIGFKYDEDALQFAKKGGFISTEYNKKKLIHTVTPVFEQCMPMIKAALKSKKARYSAGSPPSRPSVIQKPKKRKYSDDSSESRQKSREKSSHHHKKQPPAQTCLWIFGLPFHIKGKEVGDYLYYKHPAGQFDVVEWKWIRVKGSNCEFMEVILDSKKAQKLLKYDKQLIISGYPCIIVEAAREVNVSSIEQCLKQNQFKITFPEKIYPANLYSSLRGYSKVVQMVSCNRLTSDKSDSYIVTLASSSKVKDIKRLTFRGNDEIKIEDIRGQMVYRPTKQSKLTDNE